MHKERSLFLRQTGIRVREHFHISCPALYIAGIVENTPDGCTAGGRRSGSLIEMSRESFVRQCGEKFEAFVVAAGIDIDDIMGNVIDRGCQIKGGSHGILHTRVHGADGKIRRDRRQEILCNSRRKTGKHLLRGGILHWKIIGSKRDTGMTGSNPVDGKKVGFPLLFRHF